MIRRISIACFRMAISPHITNNSPVRAGSNFSGLVGGRSAILSGVVLILMCTGFPTHSQTSMSLEGCVQYAFVHHPEITLAQLDITDADWQIRENTAVALPQLSAGVDFQHFLKQPAVPAAAFGFDTGDPDAKLTFALKNAFNGRVGIDQLIFDNTFLLGLKAAREYREYVDLKLEAAKVKLRNAVTDAYLPALLLEENITILGRNIEVQERVVRETNEIFKAGFAEQLDVDRLQYVLTSLINQRDNFQRQREIMIDLLQFAMHMPVTEEIVLTDDLSELLATYANIDPDAKLDYNTKAEYITVVKARELNEIQIDFYRKPWLPTLSGFAQYQPSYQGNDELFWIPSALVGLRLNVPIWDGGMTKARRERATVSALKVDVQKETLERVYDLELESARKQYANALARVDNEQKNLDLAQRIYDTSQIKFQSGVGSSIEVTQAQAGLYQSQALLIQARYELLQARVALKNAFGR